MRVNIKKIWSSGEDPTRRQDDKGAESEKRRDYPCPRALTEGACTLRLNTPGHPGRLSRRVRRDFIAESPGPQKTAERGSGVNV